MKHFDYFKTLPLKKIANCKKYGFYLKKKKLKNLFMKNRTFVLTE